MVDRTFIQIHARDESQISKSPGTHAGGQTDVKIRATFALLCIIMYIHVKKIFRFQKENYRTKNRVLIMNKLDNTAIV
jgi:hypothetical protein